MTKPKISQRGCSRDSAPGFALVVVLALIALATVVVIAYFSRSASDLAVSGGSTGAQTSAELARASLGVILQDLRQEVVDGSEPPVDPVYPVYVPKQPVNAMPARVGTTDEQPNLIKRTASGLPFDGTTGSGRASAVSTGAPALDGRRLDAAFWNKPRLLAAAPPILPDWIYLTRSGQTPTSLGSDQKVAGMNPIVGRFACMIYDEGGLLDANIAGSPATVSAADIALKGYLAKADLTKIGLSAADVAKLVQWRNANSGSSATSFLRMLKREPSGFRVAPLGDRAFVSRQQLLRFFDANGLPATSLPFLGTFSRGINQPSFGPAGPNLPSPGAVVPTETSNGGYTLATYTGNNDVGGLQPQVNPRPLEVRVSTPFDRFEPLRAGDESKANVGDPLIRRRFPLDRLAWLTPSGPIAPGGALTTDANVLQPLLDAGFSPEFLRLGTPENINKAFGLTWGADPAGSGRNVWIYDHEVSGRFIGRLADVAAAGRDADALELLKASLLAGSLAKGTASGPGPGLWQQARDIRVDFHVLQIFANLVDQFDSDGYPTEIALPSRFPDADVLGLFERKVRGIENLPYIVGTRPSAIPVRQSIPSAADWDTNPRPSNPAPADPGLVVMLLNHWVWNPHNLARPLPGNRPGEFRIVTFLGDPAHPDQSGLASNTLRLSEVWQSGWGVPTNPASQFRKLGNLVAGSVPFLLNESTTELLFDSSADGKSYGQPTALVYPGNAASPNLRLGPAHALRTLSEGSAGSVQSIVDIGRRYVGTLLSTFPLRGQPNSSSGTNLLAAQQIQVQLGHSQVGQQGSITSLLQYRLGNRWVTYDVKTSFRNVIDTWLSPNRAPFDPVQPGNDTGTNGARTFVWTDPRTNRFGSPMRQAGVSLMPRLGARDDPRLATLRPTAADGGYLQWFVCGMWKTTTGPGEPLATLGWIANAPSASTAGPANTYLPFLAENNASLPTAYRDADGIVRGGMATNSPSGTLIGKPFATTSSPGDVADENRPVILNRPFASVAEMGYVFRDLPWKQLDFFTPESGDAALLDTFCIKEDATADAVVAGRVNLNTRNPEVLAAVFAGAGRDLRDPSTGMNGTEPSDFARLLVDWTKSSAAGKGPLITLGDFVGRFRGGNYEGFFKDNPAPFPGGSTSPNNILQRYREAPLRALADVGEVRVWNLFIDLVAQSGFCGASASGLDQFFVRGETHWWIHLAIDRATGRIIDQQIEISPP